MAPYRKTEATPSLGTPAGFDDITGGIGWAGMEKRQHFVDTGGLLITLGNGSVLPLDGGIVRVIRPVSGGGRSGGLTRGTRRARRARMCASPLTSRIQLRLRISGSNLRLLRTLSNL